jgi:glutamate synthase (NADPH) small chain
MNQGRVSTGRSKKRMRERQAIVVREQLPAERIQSFSEVSLGYSPKEAMAEALRCHRCKGEKAGCMSHCPIGINIPGFISQIAAGEFREAYETVTRDNMLPGICGRVCPQEKRCRLYCTAGEKGESVSVGHLERFIGDWHIALNETPKLNLIPQDAPNVAVIGSGPSGLICAADLARLKYKVAIFEASNEAGGVLAYGIPEFRLPKVVTQREIAGIHRMGVDFRFNAVIDSPITLKDIIDKQGFQAVFLGSSAGLPLMIDIPGKDLKGVFSAREFLKPINMTKDHQSHHISAPSQPIRKVVVAGGGNSAMYCARAAVRMGASEVTIIYRRSLSELPARHEEVEHVRQEGIRFLFLSTPVRLIGGADKSLRRVECIEMDLGDPDSSGRPRPIPKAGSEFQLEADIFIAAIGEAPNPMVFEAMPELALGRNGSTQVDPQTHQTNIPDIFAGGDIFGGATVISAMAHGRAGARAIHEYLSRK